MRFKMIEEKQKQIWYLDVLSTHANGLYSDLLYESDLQSSNLKEVEFEKMEDGLKTPIQALRGYYANKNRKKYFLDGKLVDQLPIRVMDKNEELINKEDVVIRPLNPRQFKIIPEGMIEVRKLIDDFAPFEHNNPPEWTLLKMIAIASYISRTYICIATTSAFGKSSVFDLLHYLTDKSPVFKPRSIPGVLNHINGTGNMVFDETHRCKKDVRDIIEEFSLQIGGGKSLYINGALKSANTKSRYDCTLQSITFLYNLVTNYNDPTKEYFEFIFSNNKAVDDRFLKFRFDGILTEKFKKEFDIPGTAEENKMLYINYAKTLLFMQKVKQENKYSRRFNHHMYPQKMSNRQRMSYENITWVIDFYSGSQKEYDDLVGFLNDSVYNYREMVAPLFNELVDIDRKALTGNDYEDVE